MLQMKLKPVAAASMNLKIVCHNPTQFQIELVSLNNATFIFIYNGIFVRATCFDLVGHPQALQENISKSCLVFLHCDIPNAYLRGIAY